ncbi:unnamed protein product [Ilex paraguariensis]|uniref:Uncharacterized protein n=1 Tax=Ilex paraguariensis TaxID=185542 RepID=A0ABC8UTN1_9AQUA
MTRSDNRGSGGSGHGRGGGGGRGGNYPRHQYHQEGQYQGGSVGGRGRVWVPTQIGGQQRGNYPVHKGQSGGSVQSPSPSPSPSQRVPDQTNPSIPLNLFL